jgi:magnesium transporter
MPNTLLLPELREMLAESNTVELQEFCKLHPRSAADFMEGLTADEAWRVLQHADPDRRVQIFSYFEPEKQDEIIRIADRAEVASLLKYLPNDECVDLFNRIERPLADTLLALLPAAQRRDVARLWQYGEHTVGSIMTTEFARIHETATVREALEELGEQAEELETIYYLYVVDEHDRLCGVISARKLLSAIGKTQLRVGDLMERNVISVNADQNRELAARKIADYDLLAIPVVDQQQHILGIVTHDDALDVLREAHVEDVQKMGGVNPLEASYLDTRPIRLAWKRGIWLTVFFGSALFTTFMLARFEAAIASVAWLIRFIPLVISSGGNTGNQSATLVIAALAAGDLELRDWWRVVWHELLVGMLLGMLIAALGFVAALVFTPGGIEAGLVVAVTLILVVLTGAIFGAVAPLIFKRLGLDPALMSNPFVAVLIDFLGILIYTNVAFWLLGLGRAR